MSSMLFNPNVEQQALVYCFERDQQDIEKVNQMLREGWQIASVVPCARAEGRSDQCHYPPTVTYFVVFERRIQ
jgi:hypothetical protein